MKAWVDGFWKQAMTIKSKTICVSCRWHKNTHEGSTGCGPSPDTWFYQVCLHPEVQAVPEQCPVTGKSMFAHKNDLGRAVLVETPFPYCRDINHGNCPYFEAKTLRNAMKKVYNHVSR